MPIDFTDWKKSNQTYFEDSKTTKENAPWLKPDDLGGTREYVTNNIADLVPAIIEAKFKDYQYSSNAKFVNQKPDSGVVADTGGFLGNQVRVGNLRPSSPDVYYHSASGKNSAYRGNTTTDQVMDALGTSLHEIMHTRQQQDREELQKTTLPANIIANKAWVAMLKDATKHNFPSVPDNGTQNGDTLQEFLASAVAIKDMQERGITPTGTLKDAAKGLPLLEKKYSWLPKYINDNRRPEVPTLKTWEPGIMQTVLDFIKGK